MAKARARRTVAKKTVKKAATKVKKATKKVKSITHSKLASITPKKKAPSLAKLMEQTEVSSFFNFVRENNLREKALKVLSAKIRANKIKASKAKALS